jgi:hypothetical protein
LGVVVVGGIGCVMRFVWCWAELAARWVVVVDRKIGWGTERMHDSLLWTGYMKEVVMRGRGCK